MVNSPDVRPRPSSMPLAPGQSGPRQRHWRRAVLVVLAAATLALPASFQNPDPVAGADEVGYGRLTVGGRGGTIVRVRNRNDSGPGSLRAALERSGRRIVRFDVGGVFTLRSEIKIKDPFITIAGETAPRPVVIRREGLLVRTHDVIIRQIRLRPGDTGGTPSETDALTLNGNQAPVYNVVVSHVSMVWGPVSLAVPRRYFTSWRSRFQWMRATSWSATASLRDVSFGAARLRSSVTEMP